LVVRSVLSVVWVSVPIARGEIAEREAAATAEEQRKAAEAARLEQEQAEAEEKHA
jgi:hypothetical protein